jgi:hypothetical protein
VCLLENKFLFILLRCNGAKLNVYLCILALACYAELYLEKYLEKTWFAKDFPGVFRGAKIKIWVSLKFISFRKVLFEFKKLEKFKI